MIAIATLAASTRAADWPTDGANSQRTNWKQSETLLAKDTVANLKTYGR